MIQHIIKNECNHELILIQKIDKRVDDLLNQMTLEEKTCQMATLYGYKRVANDELPTEEWKNRIVEPGEFKIFIGSSSEDIRLNGVLNIQ